MATTLTSVVEVLDRLATFSSGSDPVLSLYLDLRPDQHGRRRHREFFDRAFSEQVDTFEPPSQARRQLEKDAKRVHAYLEMQLSTSAQTAAIFSCSGDPQLFEGIQLETPTDGHRLYIDRRPHLFPLARLTDEYAKYAALVVDTNSARLYVFAIGDLQRKLVIQNEKATRTPGVDVFSEGEYQRNAENLHLKHMKEVAAAVERVARGEGVHQIFVAAGPAALALLKDVLPREIAKKLIEVSNLDMHSADAEVLRVTVDAFRQAHSQRDRDEVAQVLNAFRARGLGTIGLARVRAALTLGQVDRLLVPAAPSADAVSSVEKTHQGHLSEAAIEELVLMARQTGAAVTFVENAALLTAAGGVAGFLRFRLPEPDAGRE